MRSQYTPIHIEIVLNVHTFILQYIFSGWGNKMSPENIRHHFCIWHPPSFDFYIAMLSHGTNEIFLPDRLKKKSNPAGQPSDYKAESNHSPEGFF